MDSKEYWAAREEEALRGYVHDEKEYDRQIQRIYQNQLDAIQKEINSFYGKYASKEGITIAEAKKRVSKLDIAEYERKAAKYVKEKNFSQKANEEMALYNLTMKVNRLELLKANIGLEMIAGTDELDKYMAEILQGRTEDELKRMGGILGKSVKANSKKAAAIPNASFHNATFSDRIWMYQDILKADLSKLLQTGLIQGKNPRVLARELKKAFDTTTYNAERLMRTELARVQTEAQKQSFQRNGFSLYEYIANSNCCGVCQGLNGKHFKVEKMMPGENAPPMHPHCRCSTAAWEDSEEYNAWVDYLANGGTTEKWNNRKNNAITNADINKYGESIKYNLDGLSEDSRKSVIEKIRSLSGRYNTCLREVQYNKSLGAVNGKEGGRVDITGSLMEIKNSKVVTHEFFHTLDSTKRSKRGFETEDDFWKEAKGLFRKYKKDANAPGNSVRISSYSVTDADEFFAEAFAVANSEKPADTFGVGSLSPYVEAAIKIIDKYFKKK